MCLLSQEELSRIFIGLPLTVLGDESDTAVHNDWHAVLCQLLVAECVAICAGCQRDGRVPQRKVCLAEAMDVNRPGREIKTIPDPSDSKVSFY